MKNIIVSDVTLKEVYVENLSLTFRERLSIAEKLDLSGVDAIELPTLSNNKEDEVILRTIASSIKNSIVKIPVGVDACDIAKAVDCVKNAKKFSLQIVMPVSTASMEYTYHLKAPAMLAKIVDMVKESVKYGGCVEFVAQDAFRAEEGFVEQCAKAVYDAGACAITLSDDAGEALPEDYAKLIAKVKSVCDIKVFVKTSNAISMAAANVVASVKAGADGIKTSSLGANLSFATVAQIFSAKKFNLDANVNVDFTKANTLNTEILNCIKNGSVEEETVFNANAGVIDASATLKDVTVLTKKMGYELSDEDVGKVFDEVKRLLVKKEQIDVKELEVVIATTAMQVPSTYHLINFVVNSGNTIPATASITLEKDGEKLTGVSTGDGPIDAAFHAIEQIVGHHYELDEYQVQAVTKGRGALGSSLIRLRADGKLYPGNGASTDIIGACIRAYINALNKIVYEGK